MAVVAMRHFFSEDDRFIHGLGHINPHRPLDFTAGYMEYFPLQPITNLANVTSLQKIYAHTKGRDQDWIVTHEKTPKYLYGFQFAV